MKHFPARSYVMASTNETTAVIRNHNNALHFTMLSDYSWGFLRGDHIRFDGDPSESDRRATP